MCKSRPHWPTHETIYKWLNQHNEFSDLYAREKANQISVLIDEVLELSNDSTQDNMLNEKGQPITNHENIHRSRLRIDTRKWLASKLVPRLYGNKELKECPECAKHSELSTLTDDELKRRCFEALYPEEI